MKVVINPDYLSLKSFVEQLPIKFDQNDYGTSIYKGRNEIKQFQIDGYNVTVKSYKIPILINKIIYKYFREGKASRSFKYAQLLLKKGIETPPPVGYVETYRNGLFYRSYYVSLYESYPRIMREFDIQPGINGREDILEAFAALTVKLHENEILHLDYSPGNILFDKKETGEINFSLLDLNRMRFGPLSQNECMRNFDRISHHQEVVEMIARAYAGIRGWDKDECAKKALIAQAEFLEKIQLKSKGKELFKEKKK